MFFFGYIYSVESQKNGGRMAHKWTEKEEKLCRSFNSV